LTNRAGGIPLALRRLEIDESRDIAKYGEQLEELGDTGSIAILDHVIEDEKDHYRELDRFYAATILHPPVCRRSTSRQLSRSY